MSCFVGYDEKKVLECHTLTCYNKCRLDIANIHFKKL